MKIASIIVLSKQETDSTVTIEIVFALSLFAFVSILFVVEFHDFDNPVARLQWRRGTRMGSMETEKWS